MTRKVKQRFQVELNSIYVRYSTDQMLEDLSAGDLRGILWDGVQRE